MPGRDLTIVKPSGPINFDLTRVKFNYLYFECISAAQHGRSMPFSQLLSPLNSVKYRLMDLYEAIIIIVITKCDFRIIRNDQRISRIIGLQVHI